MGFKGAGDGLTEAGASQRRHLGCGLTMRCADTCSLPEQHVSNFEPIKQNAVQRDALLRSFGKVDVTFAGFLAHQAEEPVISLKVRQFETL